jgi:hypothetical protein
MALCRTKSNHHHKHLRPTNTYRKTNEMVDAVSKLVSLPKDGLQIENGETKLSSTATTQEGKVTAMENTYAKDMSTLLLRG